MLALLLFTSGCDTDKNKNFDEFSDDDGEEVEDKNEEDLSEEGLEFLEYDGEYSGVWTISGGFSAPLALNVSVGVVAGSANFYTTLPSGYSTSDMVLSGLINDDGYVDGNITGTGATFGENLGSTVSFAGSFFGLVEGNTMAITYNYTAVTNIPNYAPMTNTDAGTIELSKQEW